MAIGSGSWKNGLWVPENGNTTSGGLGGVQGIGMPAAPKDPKGRLDDDPSGGLLPEYSNGGEGQFNWKTQQPGAGNYGNTFQNQLKTAQDYRDNLGKTSDEMYGAYYNQAKGSLKQNLKQNDEQFGARGLLGSGLQASGAGQQKAATATDLTNKRQEINSGLLDNLNQLEGNAYGTAQSMVGDKGPDLMNPYMEWMQNNIATQNQDRSAAAQMYGGIGGALGTGAGYLANSMYKQNPMNNVTQYGPWAGGYGNGSMGSGYYKG